MHKIFVKNNFSIILILFLNIIIFDYRCLFSTEIEVKSVSKKNKNKDSSGLLLNGQFSKTDFYNIYKTLNSDFCLFMKLSIREAVSLVLMQYNYSNQKSEVFVGHMSEVIKTLLKYFRKISMNEEFSFFENQRIKIESKINKHLEIFDIISNDKNCKFSPDIKEFKNDIKRVLLYSCDSNLDSDLGSCSAKIKTLLWALYIAPLWKNKLKEHQDELIFMLAFPMYQNSILNTYKNIGISNTLKETICRELKTSYGFLTLFSREIFPTFVNSKMAIDIIGRRTELIEIFLNEEKNKQEIKKVKSTMKEIESLIGEIKKINIEGVKVYLSKFIPKEIPFIGVGGINSNFLSYLFHNFREQWGSTAMYIGRGLYGVWSNKDDNEKNKILNKNMVENNSFLKIFFPFIGQMSLRKTINSDFVNMIKSNNSSSDKDSNDLFIAKKGFLSALYNVKSSIADEAFYSQQSDSLHHKLIRGVFGNTFGPWTWAIASNSMVSFASLYYLYDIGTSFVAQVKYMSDLNKYFSLIKDIILKTKELCVGLNKIYIKNNIPYDEYLPELIECNDSLLNKKTSKMMLNMLSLWGNGFVGKTKSAINNIVFPGFVAKFFFQKFIKDKSLESIYSLIGSIDLMLSKVSLLKSSEKRSLKFCVPKIITDSKAVKLDIKNMWYPNLYGKKPVLNTIYLGEEKKNGIIVSPTAGGKTVTLSTILTNIYMSNMGIVTAESMDYTYFFIVMDNLIPSYAIGSGESNNIAERKAMKRIKNVSDYYKSIGENIIVFVDEMYKGTTPRLAVTSAFNDIKEIASNSNLIFIMTTHFPELAKISENKELMMKLYYLLVYEDDGVFENTYLLKEDLQQDNEQNWWMKDFEKAKRYQEYQDRKYFSQNDYI
jgi:hypothetical protein